MKTLFLLTCAFLALAASASAEIIGVEQLDYPDGTIATKNGGTFWDYKNFAPTGHTGTASTWDNFTGAPVVASGRLVTDNSSAKREPNGALESDGAVNDPASVPSSVAKTVYYRVTFPRSQALPGYTAVPEGPPPARGSAARQSLEDTGVPRQSLGTRGKSKARCRPSHRPARHRRARDDRPARELLHQFHDKAVLVRRIILRRQRPRDPRPLLAGAGVSDDGNDYASSALKPAGSKCRSPVSASVNPSSAMTTKEMQSVSDHSLSSRCR